MDDGIIASRERVTRAAPDAEIPWPRAIAERMEALGKPAGCEGSTVSSSYDIEGSKKKRNRSGSGTFLCGGYGSSEARICKRLGTVD